MDLINQIARSPSIDDAIDLIFEEIDRLLKEGGFEECDTILFGVDPLAHPASITLAFLTITYAAKNKLKYREHLFNITESAFVLRYGERHTQRLLQGLR